MSQRMVVSEEDLYEVLSFLVTSAHMCVVEPEFYGSFRLIDAACRLTGLVIESGQLPADQFLREFKEDADKRKLLLMTDEEGYFQFLEDATQRMAKEMKKRTGAAL